MPADIFAYYFEWCILYRILQYNIMNASCHRFHYVMVNDGEWWSCIIFRITSYLPMQLLSPNTPKWMGMFEHANAIRPQLWLLLFTWSGRSECHFIMHNWIRSVNWWNIYPGNVYLAFFYLLIMWLMRRFRINAMQSIRLLTCNIIGVVVCVGLSIRKIFSMINHGLFSRESKRGNEDEIRGDNCVDQPHIECDNDDHHEYIV